MPEQALTCLVRRLEAATSRLEHMAQSLPDQSSQINGTPSAPRTIPAADGTDQLGGTTSTPMHALEPLPQAIEDFDNLINGDVKTYVNMSEELGGLVSEQVRTASAVNHRITDYAVIVVRRASSLRR